MTRPSALNANGFMFSCAMRDTSLVALEGSSTRTMSSAQIVTTCSPSGVNATASTASGCSSRAMVRGSSAAASRTPRALSRIVHAPQRVGREKQRGLEVDLFGPEQLRLRRQLAGEGNRSEPRGPPGLVHRQDTQSHEQHQNRSCHPERPVSECALPLGDLARLDELQHALEIRDVPVVFGPRRRIDSAAAPTPARRRDRVRRAALPPSLSTSAARSPARETSWPIAVPPAAIRRGASATAGSGSRV